MAGWLGTGCKEVMVTVPLVLLLYDRVFLSDSWRIVVRRRWAFYSGLAPAMIWLVFASVSVQTENDKVSAGFACSTATPLEYLSSQPGVVLHYLRLAVLPDRLCFDYQWPIADAWLPILLPGALVTALLTASLISLRYRPPLGFLGLSFFLILAPTSSIMAIADLAVEHRMYLPLASLIILLVVGFHAIVPRLLRPEAKPAALYAAVLLFAVATLSLRTFVRNRVYCNPIVMWSNTVAASPHNDRAHNNLAFHLDTHDLSDLAANHYLRAIELNPENHQAHRNYARFLNKRGERKRALVHLRRALAIKPENHKQAQPH